MMTFKILFEREFYLLVLVIIYELRKELEKSTFVRTWGRDVIFAIDRDDPTKLIEIFNKLYFKEANINEKTSQWNYAGYSWTPNIYEFLGDTALHIALKQKRKKAIYALIVLNADLTIANAVGVTPNDLSVKQFGESIFQIKSCARYNLLPHIHPRLYPLLPEDPTLNGVEVEAMTLIESGICLYSEPPKYLQINKIARTKVQVRGRGLGLGRVSEKEKTLENGCDCHLNNETTDNRINDENEDSPLVVDNPQITTATIPGILLERKYRKAIEEDDDDCDDDDDDDGGDDSDLDNDPSAMWASGGLDDVVSMLQRQSRRYRRQLRAEQMKRSGLSLLNVAVADKSHPEANQRLLNTPGIEKLRFTKSMKKAPVSVVAPSPARTHTGSALDPHTRSSVSSLSASIKQRVRESAPAVTSKAASTAAAAPVAVLNDPYESKPMYITEVSTRGILKYARICNDGASKIASVLRKDRIVTTLVLACGRIGCVGAVALSHAIPSMGGLQRLDLSQNCIGDEGATALARALSLNQEVVRVNLSANRISDIGLSLLVDMVLRSGNAIEYLNLHKNQGSQQCIDALLGSIHAAGGNNSSSSQPSRRKEEVSSFSNEERESVYSLVPSSLDCFGDDIDLSSLIVVLQ